MKNKNSKANIGITDVSICQVTAGKNPQDQQSLLAAIINFISNAIISKRSGSIITTRKGNARELWIIILTPSPAILNSCRYFTNCFITKTVELYWFLALGKKIENFRIKHCHQDAV